MEHIEVRQEEYLMRKINFKVRNIGSEKYLSYVLDDDCDLDEELLDYLDENKIPELIDIIYEEDDENDYLTYNITDRVAAESLISGTVNAEMMLGIIRGVASGIINMRDLGIPVSYVILNKGFTYVNPVTYDVKLLCIPVESDANIIPEFKIFVRDLIMSATYPEDEDCNYVAKIINMLNTQKFTIRGFIGQITELMESAGMQVEEQFMDVGDSGIEVSQSVDVNQPETSLDDLPEYNNVSFDDEDDGLKMYEEEPTEENNIFKDLDLDSEETVTSDTDTISSVDMHAFDESNLEELEIEDIPEEETAEEAGDISEEVQEATTVDEAVAEEQVGMTETLTMEGMTETLSADEYTSNLTSDEDIVVEENKHKIHEVAHTAEGVTEIMTEEDAEKPVLIDTKDLDNLIEEPPVVKNIRINRAKIIQKTVAETEEDEVVDNPTEQIIGGSLIGEGGSTEPETNMKPVTVEEPANTETGKTGSTVELAAGMNVVKEPEPEKKPAAGVPKAIPYIVRVNTGERVMVNKAVFKLGKANRGVDFTISGNGAISKVHAIIYQREDGWYLKDNKATNATYVDKVKLDENQEVKLKNDSNITIGGEDFLFKF
jgi:hypothetical protein